MERAIDFVGDMAIGGWRLDVCTATLQNHIYDGAEGCVSRQGRVVL